MSSYSPVAIIVYNRKYHTKKVIESLKKNKLAEKTDLFIFSDAPKDSKDEKSVLEIREYIKTINDGFNSVTIYEYKENKGIKDSTLNAISIIFEQYETFIGLEDDVEVNEYFLSFMNDALQYYKNDEDILTITAFSHKNITKHIKRDIIFSCAFHSWGWATWKGKWSFYDWYNCDISWYNNSIKHKICGSIYSWFHLLAINKAVKNNIELKSNLWDVYLSYILYKNKKLCLWLTNYSFTSNIGFDGSGVHKYNFYDTHFINKDIEYKKIKFDDNKHINIFNHLYISIKLGVFNWLRCFFIMFIKKLKLTTNKK